jgi:HAD superfamily hydrolase (TIGR01490 family)
VDLHVQLALFDLDHTLLDSDSDNLWFHFLTKQGALGKTLCTQKRASFSAAYREGRQPVQDFYAFVLKPLADNSLHQLLAWRRQFVTQHILSRITAAARALLARHREAGHILAIITATNRFISEPIAAELGVRHLFATELEYDGLRFTSRALGAPCFREGKIQHLHEWLKRNDLHPMETWFYSDSHNDLPLLESVNHPVDVNPDVQLIGVARSRGWPSLRLRRKLAIAEN